MSYRTDIAYLYDGTFEGLLCCVFESYEKKEIPFDIYSADAEQGFLYEAKWIDTDPHKADRVFQSIPKKISGEAQELVRLGWFSCAPDKEILILRFLRLGFTHGRKVMDMLADDTVHALLKAVQQLKHEGHRYTGFVRFSAYGPVLAAIIEPQNQVLPVIQDHFCDRFGTETFLIYDQTHGMALVHRPGESNIIAIDELTLPEIDSSEADYRLLWQKFYDTIAIEGRINPRLRMNHMPKRFWSRLTEFMDHGHTKVTAIDRSSGSDSRKNIANDSLFGKGTGPLISGSSSDHSMVAESSKAADYGSGSKPPDESKD